MFRVHDMKQEICRGILSAAAVAACVDAQAQSNVYCAGIYASGTTYWNYGSFDFPSPPYHLILSGRDWYQDAHGFVIINAGHEMEKGGILHRVLEVGCGSESFTIPFEPGATNLQLVGAPGYHSVLALVMETGYPERPVTLIAVLDGSVGLYSTNGGSMIREGQNSKLNLGVSKLVAEAGEFRSACTIVREFPLPQKAYTRFYIITPCEVLTAQVEEQALRAGEHRLSPLFQAAQDLIAQMHVARSNKKVEPSAAPNVGSGRPVSNSSATQSGNQ